MAVLRPQRNKPMGDSHESGSDVEAQASLDRSAGPQRVILGHHSIQHGPACRPPLAQRPRPTPSTKIGEVSRWIGSLEAIPVDQGESVCSHQDIPGREIPMTRHQLRILNLGRLQSLSHLPERISELRSDLGYSVRLPTDRPDNPTDVPPLARLGLALMEGGYNADGVVHNVRVRSA